MCLAPVESTAHALTECSATSDIHSHMLPELLNTVLQVQPNCTILYSPTHPQWLTQFILDCTSPNLPALHRVAATHMSGRYFLYQGTGAMQSAKQERGCSTSSANNSVKTNSFRLSDISLHLHPIPVSTSLYDADTLGPNK